MMRRSFKKNRNFRSVLRLVMKFCFLFLIAGSGMFLLPSHAQEQNNCIDCHGALGGAEMKKIDQDIHFRNDISCADCHGGDPRVETDDYEVAMDPRKGFIGVPDHQKIPDLCGKCHSNALYMKQFNPNISVDQLSQYWTSQHGLLLKKGDQKVATCSSCHGAHGILAASDPESPVYPLNIVDTCGRCHADQNYMTGYSIPTDQLEKYKKSIHGHALYDKSDISAPTCNDCHGNHGPMPPEAAAIGNVCGQCHLASWEMFIESPHKEAYLALEIPQCEVCHGNHEILKPDDEMIGTSGKAVCITCHEDGSRGYEVAEKMRNSLEELKQGISEAETLVDRAGFWGMDISEASFDIKDAGDQLTKSRASIHFFQLEKVKQLADEGLSSALKAKVGGEKALTELQFRRKGLGISLFFIAVVAVLLYMRIRRRDKAQSSQ